ncbi:hypothetical protein [Mycolicibacterium helvum]|nr:hypothetical protein [Mycolicibacterium helvum]
MTDRQSFLDDVPVTDAIEQHLPAAEAADPDSADRDQNEFRELANV